MTAEVCTISVRNMAAFHFDEVEEEGPLYTPTIRVDSGQKSCDRRSRPEKLDDEVRKQAIEFLNSPHVVENRDSDDDDREVAALVKEKECLSIEKSREESISPIGFLIDIFQKGKDTVADMIGDAGHFTEYVTKRVLNRISIQGEPENNVHFIHPVSKRIVALGLHIIEDKYGCHAVRVIEGGLASKFKIQYGDVIRKINGRDLKKRRMEEIFKMFSELDITKTIILRVVRLHNNDDGTFSLYEIDITVTITVSDDKVSFEVDAIVTATYLKYQSVTSLKYIAQTPFNESTVYVRITGNHAQVSTKLDKKCNFRMELYEGGSAGRRACVIRNDPSFQVIDKTTSWSFELGACNAPKPNKDTISNPDDKFFYWINHPHYPGESVFQSVTNEELYMAVAENNTLYQKTFNSVSDVDSTGRFKVIDATNSK